MLNLDAFRVLSDSKRVPPDMLRLLIRLMLHFDLSQFRTLPLYRVVRLCGEESTAAQIEGLVTAGLLVQGPEVRELGATESRLRSIQSFPTYRINPRFLLTWEERRGQVQELVSQRQRESIAPLESFREPQQQKKKRQAAGERGPGRIQ